MSTTTQDRAISDQRSAISSGPKQDAGRDDVAERMLQIIAEHCYVSAAEIRGESRKHEHIVPRYVAMKLMLEDLERTHAHTAAFFNRERTAPQRSCQVLRNWLDTEPRLVARVARLREELRQRGFFS